MQAVLTVARIAKEDAVEAFKLYFEPLLKALTWLRNRAPSVVGKKHRDQLLATIQTPEATMRSTEALASPSQLKDEAPLVLIRPAPLPLRLGSHRVGSMYVLFDAINQERSRIQAILSADTSRMDAVWLFASTELSSIFDSLSTASLHSFSFRDLGADMAEVRLLSRLGKTDPLEHLLRSGKLPEERRLLLKDMEQTHLPEASGQSLKRFGIYLEVAAFLAQEGYEEAAVAVVSQAFKLFRPGELVNPKKEEK